MNNPILDPDRIVNRAAGEIRITAENSPHEATGRGWPLTLLVLIGAIVLSTGCVTNGRQVLLKEYGPSVPALAESSLKGVTICLNRFTCTPNLVSLEPTLQFEEPKPFTYLDLTHEQDQRWAGEMASLQKQAPKSGLREIGNMRDALGIVMSHVYALNDPAEWLMESLKYDLESQGAKVVDASQSAGASISIGGTIQLCRADMYLMINVSLLVDLEIQPGQGALVHRSVYTHGTTLAVMASEGEYFHAFRDARQKFSIIAAREISQALNARR